MRFVVETVTGHVLELTAGLRARPSQPFNTHNQLLLDVIILHAVSKDTASNIAVPVSVLDNFLRLMV